MHGVIIVLSGKPTQMESVMKAIKNLEDYIDKGDVKKVTVLIKAIFKETPKIKYSDNFCKRTNGLTKETWCVSFNISDKFIGLKRGTDNIYKHQIKHVKLQSGMRKLGFKYHGEYHGLAWSFDNGGGYKSVMRIEIFAWD